MQGKPSDSGAGPVHCRPTCLEDDLDFWRWTLDFGLWTLAEGCAERRLVTAGRGRFDGSKLLESVKSEDSREWPLDKVSIFAGSAFPAAVAVGDFNEATARLIE